ncbi:UNVERIFIED_CONTAM: hypothetical protein HDU68_000848 [Siphonaria sp. JEL0065]|nr:hypothetical protein HDU68_000848 [Siphonaria sp. JEL0065]
MTSRNANPNAKKRGLDLVDGDEGLSQRVLKTAKTGVGVGTKAVARPPLMAITQATTTATKPRIVQTVNAKYGPVSKREFGTFRFFFEGIAPKQKAELETLVHKLLAKTSFIFKREAISHLVVDDAVLKGNLVRTRAKQQQQSTATTATATPSIQSNQYDRNISFAKQWGLKIWSTTEFKYHTSRLLQKPSASASTTAKGNPNTQLQQLINKEKQVQTTTNRGQDPSASLRGFKPLQGTYVLIEDAQQTYKTIAWKEYNHHHSNSHSNSNFVATQNSALYQSWPVLYLDRKENGRFLGNAFMAPDSEDDVAVVVDEEVGESKKRAAAMKKAKSAARTEDQDDSGTEETSSDADSENTEEKEEDEDPEETEKEEEEDGEEIDVENMDDNEEDEEEDLGSGYQATINSNASGLNNTTSLRPILEPAHPSKHVEGLMKRVLTQNLVNNKDTAAATVSNIFVPPIAAATEPQESAADPTKKRERKKRRSGPKGKDFYFRAGYCENCTAKYDSFIEHVKSKQHQAWASDKNHFGLVDQFIASVTRKRKPAPPPLPPALVSAPTRLSVVTPTRNNSRGAAIEEPETRDGEDEAEDDDEMDQEQQHQQKISSTMMRTPVAKNVRRTSLLFPPPAQAKQQHPQSPIFYQRNNEPLPQKHFQKQEQQQRPLVQPEQQAFIESTVLLELPSVSVVAETESNFDQPQSVSFAPVSSSQEEAPRECGASVIVEATETSVSKSVAGEDVMSSRSTEQDSQLMNQQQGRQFEIDDFSGHSGSQVLQQHHQQQTQPIEKLEKSPVMSLKHILEDEEEKVEEGNGANPDIADILAESETQQQQQQHQPIIEIQSAPAATLPATQEPAFTNTVTKQLELAIPATTTTTKSAATAEPESKKRIRQAASLVSSSTVKSTTKTRQRASTATPSASCIRSSTRQLKATPITVFKRVSASASASANTRTFKQVLFKDFVGGGVCGSSERPAVMTPLQPGEEEDEDDDEVDDATQGGMIVVVKHNYDHQLVHDQMFQGFGRGFQRHGGFASGSIGGNSGGVVISNGRNGGRSRREVSAGCANDYDVLGEDEVIESLERIGGTVVYCGLDGSDDDVMMDEEEERQEDIAVNAAVDELQEDGEGASMVDNREEVVEVIRELKDKVGSFVSSDDQENALPTVIVAVKDTVMAESLKPAPLEVTKTPANRSRAGSLSAAAGRDRRATFGGTTTVQNTRVTRSTRK